ncbi:hypothetical protein EXS70_00640 [Candidatus Peribacteria bacterium]|nr:hypothetical protein [Candidatus Peribacteria bacterium]
MPDPTPSPPPQQGTVPADVTQKFGDLIELINKSESMNEEERKYWVGILPVMTPEQIQNLRDILENERKQLASIDAKYQGEIDKVASAESVKQTEEDRTKRRMERTGKEAAHKEKEDEATEDILKQIEEAGGTQAR